MFHKKNFSCLQQVIKVCALLVVVLFSSQQSYAQNNLKAITTAFDDHHNSALQEKVYVHTDKNFYLTGEIIWFKLYCVDATFNKPISMSSVAYVEILDSANKPVQQAKIGLNKGEGNGSFYLSQSIASGNYKLRAYTNWMKNFDAAYYFEKNITIVNLQKLQPVSSKDSIEQFDIKFFPEGGDLVNGLQSKVAFKATAQNGKGFNFSGFILDNNDTLVRFSPFHAGMGNFIFTPQQGHNYKALIINANGNPFTKDLPIIYASGYTMQVTEDNQKLNVVVQCNISAIKEVYLLAHTRESLRYTATALLQNGKANFSFEKSVLGDGVSQLTIFNDQGKAVSERLYFKKPEETLLLTLNSAQPTYQTRKKVDIDIASSNTDAASLSMAVYKLDSLQTIDNENNIEHYLLLSSDIKGYIEDPAYYFTSTGNEALIAADNLMLTQGWRRFKWNNVLLDERPSFEFSPELNGHILKGRIVNIKTGAPQKFIECYLSVPSLLTQFRTSVSDSTGHVKFEMPNFYGGTALILQPNTLTDSVSKIEVDDPFSKEYSSSKLPMFKRPTDYPATLTDRNIDMQVQNIYQPEKLEQFYLPGFVDTSAFYVAPNLKYNLDDYTRFTSMEEVLREYVQFVNVTRRAGRVHLPVINPQLNIIYQTDPLVLLDGVPIFDFNKFLMFDPLKIKSLDVVTDRYILGNSIFEGVLNWKTYSPNLANYEFPKNATVLDYEGLQADREFYSPTYSTENAAASHLPDFRNVLEWKPNIKLNGSNKNTVEFYTSDIPGKYAVVVQGLSANGLSGSKVITFEVTK